MEIRINPIGTKLRRLVETVADPATGEPKDMEVIEVTFMDQSRDMCVVQYSPEGWENALVYLNDPETVEAEQRAKIEARSRIVVPGMEM